MVMQNDSDEAAPGVPPEGEGPDEGGADVEEKRRGRGWFKVFLALLVLMAVAAGGGYATLPLWRDLVPVDYRGFLPTFPQEDQRLAQLDATTGALRRDLGAVAGRSERMAESIAHLEQRLDALERASVAEGTTPTPALAAQSATLLAKADFESKITAVSDRLDVIAKSQISAASIAAVHERLAGIEDLVHRLSARQDSSLALVLAVAQLREAVYRGAPFEAELQALMVLAPDPAATSQTVAGFAAYASKGITTWAAMERQFEPLSAAVAQAAMAPEGSSWIDKTLQRITGLVTLRRTDGVASGDETMATMARASAHMQAGDLPGVVTEMSSLTGVPAAVASSWLDKARARVAADKALSSLTAEALGRTAAAKAGG